MTIAVLPIKSFPRAKSRTELDDGARAQLAQVAGVLVDGGHAAPGAAQGFRRQAEEVETVPGGFIELAGVPHDIMWPGWLRKEARQELPR